MHYKKLIILSLVGIILFVSGSPEKKIKPISTGIYVDYYSPLGFDSLGTFGFSKTLKNLDILYLSPDGTFAFVKNFYISRKDTTPSWMGIDYGKWSLEKDSLSLYYNASTYWREHFEGRTIDIDKDTCTFELLKAYSLNDNGDYSSPSRWYKVYNFDTSKMPKTIASLRDAKILAKNVFFINNIDEILAGRLYVR